MAPAPHPDRALPPPAVERRHAQRVSVDLFVQERDGDRLFVHPATNLSAGGIFIESASYSLRSALDRRFVDLEFALPGGPSVQARGEVVESRRLRGFAHGLAVRFLDLDPALSQAIAQWVDGQLQAGESEGPLHEAAPT